MNFADGLKLRLLMGAKHWLQPNLLHNAITTPNKLNRILMQFEAQ
jgi:hypothetical protein